MEYIIKCGQVKTDTKKIRGMAEYPEPTTHKQLLRFLGFANFYHHFIRNYSRVAAPQKRQSSSSIPFSGTSEMEHVFSRLKNLFTSPVIQVSSLDTDVGAVLFHCSIPDQKVHHPQTTCFCIYLYSMCLRKVISSSAS